MLLVTAGCQRHCKIVRLSVTQILCTLWDDCMLLHEVSSTGLHRFPGAHDDLLRAEGGPSDAQYFTLSTLACVHQGLEKTPLLLSVLYASFSAEIIGRIFVRHGPITCR